MPRAADGGAPRSDEPYVRSTGGVTLAPETCDTCHFDGAQYDLRDALGTLRAIVPMWQQTVEGVADDVLGATPGPGRMSATEHTVHSAGVVERVDHLLAGLLDGEVAASVGSGADGTGGFAAALVRLGDNVTRVHARATGIGARDPRWARTVTADGRLLDGAWLLRHAIHDATHHLRDIGRGLAQLGAGAPTHTGSVAQISVSDGGVPKRPVERAEVGPRGLVGDRQATRQHHGRPLQALCLWSAEVIAALQAEGHPIDAGSAGENLTLRDVDWSTIRPGTQLRIGEVLAEISAWATPCTKNAPWFLDRDFGRMDHDRHPGWSRAYAWVREPGTVRAGDEVTVEP